MKKNLSAIIVCIVTMAFVTTAYALDDPYGTYVSIGDSEPTIISSNVVIKDQFDNTLWDLSQTQNPRSDSYIMNTEKINVSVIIEDLDGEPEPASYNLNAIVVDDNTEYEEYYFNLQFSHYTNSPENTQALYHGEITIDHGQCQHTIYLYDSDFFPYEVIFNPLYINPYMTSSLEPSSINWTDLSLGDQNILSDNNPFFYTVKGMCFDTGQNQIPVDVDYDLGISGTDMTHTTNQQYNIPASNIEYSMSSGSYVSLQLYPEDDYIGQYVSYSSIEFNFRISIPIDIPKGEYTGDIYFDFTAV